MKYALALLLLAGCRHSQTPVSQQVFHLEPNDDVGDVVTGSPSPPSDPGIGGPSVPGGAGYGGGTPRPKGSVIKPPPD